MSDKVLDVVEGDALLEKIGDDHGPEAVRGDEAGQAGVFQTALEHGPDGPWLEKAACGEAAAVDGRERPKERPVGVIRVFDEVEVRADPALEVDPPFLAEAQGAVLSVVAEISEPEPGDGADADARACQGAEDGAIAQPDRP